MKKLFFIFFYLPFIITSQTREIDSLQLISKSNASDTIKLQALSDLNWAILSENIERAKNYAFQEITLAKKTNNAKWIAQGYNDLGLSYFKQGKLDSALTFYNKSLDIRKKLNNKALIASSLSKIGLIYYELAEYNTALDCQLKTLKIFEDLGDENKTAQTYNNISQIFFKLRNPKKEVEYGEKALAIFKKNNNEYQCAQVYGSMGNAYKLLGDAKKSNDYFNSALPTFIKYGDRLSEANIYNGLAINMRQDFKDKEALEYYKKAYNISVEEKDKLGIELFGHNISCVLTDMGNYQDALKYSLESLNSTEESNKSQLILTYRQLATIYSFMNDGKKAKFYLDKFADLKDTIFNENNAKQLVEMETKYDVEKKNLELAKNKAEITNEKNKRYITYGALAFFILLFSIAIWAFRQKKKSASLLQSKNQLLEKANHLITHQKEELSEKQKEIVDSINYAKKIQNALLANEELILENLLDHFILFKPKDIVSGDFTWATKKDNLFYLACCDSTGHGVPGAFMSLLNIGFLSEAIKERHIYEPGKIFDYARARLIETIGHDKQKDGFDGILICMDITTKQITYAAANNAPLLISNKEINYLSTNKMPVGEGIKIENFNTFSINYEKSDTLYLFTDGYPDQFGGEKGKKFKYKQLEELLSSNSDKPTAYQKEKLETTFENWRGNLEQVDDVCVIGIRL